MVRRNHGGTEGECHGICRHYTGCCCSYFLFSTEEMPSGPCRNVSISAPGRSQAQQEGKRQVFMHSGKQDGNGFQPVRNAGERHGGSRARRSSSGPRPGANSMQHELRYVRRKSSIKPQRQFFSSGPRGRRGTRFPAGATSWMLSSLVMPRQESQNQYGRPLAPAPDGASFCFRQTAVQAQESQPQAAAQE